MRSAVRRLPIEGVVPVAVAATIVTFACGSSSVDWIKRIGLDLRWVALFVLLACVTTLFLLRVAWSRARPFALAGWLAFLALLSTAWSVTPQLTFERAAALAILFVTAFLLATSAASLALIERVLAAILAGAVIVALLGLLLLAVDRDASLQPASPDVPTRFRGLGEDPDTAALLFAVVLPIAAWGVARGGRPWRRVASGAALLLLLGSIVGAISRGALAAGLIGVLVVALAAPRTWATRWAYAAATLALAAVSYGLTTVPAPGAGVVAAHVGTTSSPSRVAIDANGVFPLDDDIGTALPGPDGRPRSAEPTGAGGRRGAWRGALEESADRPVVGHGFGTEDKVFVDRYRGFSGNLVHNYYLGLLLQLGAVGLASFLALMLLWLFRSVAAYDRLAERDRLALVACVGMVLAGLAAAVVQSYLTSVGNIATVSFWIGAFLLAALGDPRSVWPWRPPVD